MNILLIGANGFIGSNLIEKVLLSQPEWTLTALDLNDNNIQEFLTHPNLHFKKGDMTEETQWIREKIRECDVVLPLAAIATPATYVQDPLRIFSLDFEANLAIVRMCVEFNKRVIFPSTSEVYGMCQDQEFDEEKSSLVLGPIHKERWIYSCSKQLMDRIIYAYGKHHDLPYTLFRPFNWIGPKQDNIQNSKMGGSRVVVQFLGNIARGESIQLVDGGKQERSFIYIDDGIDALIKMIENAQHCADDRIFNIGNPHNVMSIKDLASTLLELTMKYPKYAEKAKHCKLIEVPAAEYYGTGYQDVQARVPAIWRAQTELNWQPKTDLKTTLEKTVDYYFKGE